MQLAPSWRLPFGFIDLFVRIFWQIGRICLCGLGRRMWFQLESMQAKCGALSTLKRARVLQALEQAHREEQEQLRATHRGAMRDLQARNDQMRAAQRESFRESRPHCLSEHQQQRQIERGCRGRAQPAASS
eukprot:1034991-Pelagomonas_calceolata.AAC.2